jgi:hypothetical protein
MAVAVIVTPPLVEEPDHHVRDEESGEAQQHPQAGRFARGARVRESVQKHIAQQAAGSHRLSQRHESTAGQRRWRSPHRPLPAP